MARVSGRARFILLAALAIAPAVAAQPARDLAEATFPGKTYPNGRHGWIYTPPGYPQSCGAGCNLIIAFDGAMYLGAMPMNEILDSLLAAKRIPPTVAVLFDNGAPPGRIDDLANSARFAGFIADELLPWVRDHYVVTRSAKRTILAGSSAGGLGAAYIALNYPALFGNVLSQSGAFWRGNEASDAPPYEWVTTYVATSEKANVRFFLDVGALETYGALGGTAPSLVDANRRLADALRTKGYRVDFFEVPNGTHSPGTWRNRLPIGIVALSDTTK